MNRAAILAALAAESDPSKQRKLVTRLTDLDQRTAAGELRRAEASAAERIVGGRVTPAVTHTRHTAQTDWLAKAGNTTPDAEVHWRAVAEATKWFQGRPPQVVASLDELQAQALGYASRWSSQFDGEALSARSSFMQRISHLSGFKLASDPDDERDDKEDDEDLAADDPWREEGRYGSKVAEWEGQSCSRCGGNNVPSASRCNHCGGVLDPNHPKSKSSARKMALQVGDAVSFEGSMWYVSNQSDDGRFAITPADGYGMPLDYFKDMCRWISPSDVEVTIPRSSHPMFASRKTAARPLYEIAQEIRGDWKNVNYGAAPYLDAMDTLDSIGDMYYQDSALSIVMYFLSNASAWKGETAKRVKDELKAMTKRGSRTAGGAPQFDGFYRTTGPDNDKLEWVPPADISDLQLEKERLFPNGIPLHGDLTPEQEAWLKRRASFSSTASFRLVEDPEADQYEPYLPFSVVDDDGVVMSRWPDRESAQKSLDQFMRTTSGSRRTADQGFGPDTNSQSGYAESELPWVDVSATDTFEMGWTQDDPEGADEMAPEGEIGPFDASRRSVASRTCPNCGGKDIYAAEKMLGSDYAGKSFCDDCKHTWGTKKKAAAPSRTAAVDGEIYSKTIGGIDFIWEYDSDSNTVSIGYKGGSADMDSASAAEYGSDNDPEEAAEALMRLWISDGMHSEAIDTGRYVASRSASRRTAISLTNVGFEGGIGSNVGVGTAPDGQRIRFRLSDKDAKDLASVMTSDLAVNFSGVDIEESDIITGNEGQPSDSYVDWMNRQGSQKTGGRLQCNMRDDCADPVTMIGSDGYIYCSRHGVDRRASGAERVRKMTPGEIALLQRGGQIASYSRRRTADQGFGPDANSQSGHAESALPDVTVDEDEDANLGWIDEGNDDLKYELSKDASAVLRATQDGKYRLTGPRDGYYWLESPDGEGGWYEVGAVMDPENFEVAVDNAEEEMQALMEQARMEFGGARKQAAEVTRFDDGHSEWKCNRCGATVERWPGMSDVDCEKCGAWYNAAGQQLRDDWMGNPSNYDDDISDLDGYEMQHADDDYSSRPGWDQAYGSIRRKADAPFAGNEDGSKPAGAAPHVSETMDEAMFEADEVKDFTGPEGAAANLSFAPPFMARCKPTINNDELGLW